MSEAGDMSSVIIPKSDQWNADDFLTGPKTFKIQEVIIKGGQEQPVWIVLEGTKKYYRSCKGMNRVLVACWGSDSKKYPGRSLTLYCNPTVRWAGMEVGGIEISHVTDIEREMAIAVTVSKGKKKIHIVKPLILADPTQAVPEKAEPTISDAQRKRLEARIGEVGIARDKVKKYVKKTFGKEHFADMNKAEYDIIDKMLTDYVPPKGIPEPTLSDRIKSCATVAELDALADGFTEAEAVAHTAEYTARKNELLDAAEGAL